MGKFKEEFNEPVQFSDNTLVIDGEISAEVAATAFSLYTGEEVKAEDLKKDSVRYGFAPENVEDMAGQSCWYTGGREGKGSKAVWTVPS